jgi:hypothetical protein
MKEDPKDHVIPDYQIDSKHEEEEFKEEKPRNLEARKKKKWYDVINFKEMVPLLPVLRRIRGSKKNITIPIFTELNDSAQSIFERNKALFRFRTQVDLMAYYWGMRVLEQIYLSHKGLPVSELSKLLEDREEEYRIFDDMKTIKELFQKDVERFSEGMIDEEEVHANWDKYLATIKNPKYKKRMEKIMDRMIDEGEEYKAKERMRKKADYNRSKFRIVDEN